VLHAVVLTQYRRVTDGIAIASTALAMRALHASIAAHCNNISQYGRQSQQKFFHDLHQICCPFIVTT